jgi:hypothetical protein
MLRALARAHDPGAGDDTVRSILWNRRPRLVQAPLVDDERIPATELSVVVVGSGIAVCIRIEPIYRSHGVPGSDDDGQSDAYHYTEPNRVMGPLLERPVQMSTCVH